VVKAKKFIVSTCEELSFPWGTHPDLSRKIDRLAADNNVAVLSTGVNPGFLMDSLPIFLTTACLDVKKVKVERFQNASLRRVPFQKKIGVGDTLTQF
jgi:2,4-diaminopentanoate dehydrogenase